MRRSTLVSASVAAGVVIGSLLLLANRYVAQTLRVSQPLNEGRVPALIGRLLGDFTLEELAGGPVSSLRFTGYEYILVFGGYPCAPCEPTYERLKRGQFGAPVALVLVCANPDEERAGLVQFIEEQAIGVPVAVAEGELAEALFGLVGVPMVLRVDGQGVVRDAVAGGPPASYALDLWTRRG